MRRFITIFCVLVLFTGASFGQGNMGVSVMGGATFPTGDFGDVYGTGFGVNGVFHYALSPSLSIIGTTGYLRWSDSQSESFFGETFEMDVTIGSIPILAGVRYYLMPGDFSAYLNGELGIHILSFKTEGSMMGETFSESTSETEFGFGVGAGALFAISPSMLLDANVKYNSISGEGSSLDFISVLVGVHFPF